MDIELRGYEGIFYVTEFWGKFFFKDVFGIENFDIVFCLFLFYL